MSKERNEVFDWIEEGHCFISSVLIGEKIGLPVLQFDRTGGLFVEGMANECNQQ